MQALVISTQTAGAPQVRGSVVGEFVEGPCIASDSCSDSYRLLSCWLEVVSRELTDHFTLLPLCIKGARTWILCGSKGMCRSGLRG